MINDSMLLTNPEDQPDATPATILSPVALPGPASASSGALAGAAVVDAATSVAVVTVRPSSPAAPVTAITPPHMPNVLVVPITVTKRLAIRTVKTYLQSLVGFLTLGGITGNLAPGAAPIPLTTFDEVFLAAAGAALVPAAMSLCTNLLILFTRLDESNPSLMA